MFLDGYLRKQESGISSLYYSQLSHGLFWASGMDGVIASVHNGIGRSGKNWVTTISPLLIFISFY